MIFLDEFFKIVFLLRSTALPEEFSVIIKNTLKNPSAYLKDKNFFVLEYFLDWTRQETYYTVIKEMVSYKYIRF